DFSLDGMTDGDRSWRCLQCFRGPPRAAGQGETEAEDQRRTGEKRRGSFHDGLAIIWKATNGRHVLLGADPPPVATPVLILLPFRRALANAPIPDRPKTCRLRPLCCGSRCHCRSKAKLSTTRVAV